MVISQNRHRYAVIGAAAGVFSAHRSALLAPTIELVALSDINQQVGEQRALELNCAFFADYHQLLKEMHPDVVIVMTPHTLHARIAIDCLQAGCHVLEEKPMAVQVAEADAMIEAAEEHQRLLCVIFQHRFRPDIRAIKTLLDAGRLGSIQHIAMSAVWTRTASYYRSASWRGTWRGEGGGVLMNQAPHHLDILCHLFGLPTRVFAWNRTRMHKIKTEDTVQAMLEWENGASGSLHISTAEADESEYLKIVGTRGWLELRQGKLTCQLLETDLKEFIAHEPDPFATPRMHPFEITLEAGRGDHSAVYQAFEHALTHNQPFTSTGIEGRMSLELANALIYSSHSGTSVELPLDREKYASLLSRLQSSEN